jgi:hypothetical protein
MGHAVRMTDPTATLGGHINDMQSTPTTGAP